MKKILIISVFILIYTAFPLLSQNILKVIEDGNLDKVKELIEKNPKLLNRADSSGNTPLHYAANSGQLNITTFLIRSGAEINTTNTYGYSALHYSIIGRQFQTAELLLQKGADVDLSNVWGLTPLHTCAARNYIEGAELLIDYKTNVNKRSEDGKTPLHLAVGFGHMDMIKLLLKKNANVDAADNIGQTAVFSAVVNNRTEILKYLIDQGASAGVKDKSAKTPFHRAVIAGYLNPARILIKNGADINSRDDKGKTPVFYAAKYGHNTLKEWLRSAGADAESIPASRGYFDFSAANLKTKEALIWYLGHSGWAVKTQNHLLIFDYFENTDRPEEPKLANGRIHTPEIFDQQVYVFISHEHGDHFDKSILDWKDSIKRIKYIFGWQAFDHPDYFYMGPKKQLRVDDIEIECMHSPEAGAIEGNFLIKVDGLVLYHSGDYSRGHEVFQQDMRSLKKAADKIDLFFMLAGNRMDNEEALFALKIIEPAFMFPMHGGGNEHTYKEFAVFAGKANLRTTIICAENRGDTFLYRGGKISLY